MDPRLAHLFESGDPDDNVAAILRVDNGRFPDGTNVVARFGDIATVRLRRRDIPELRTAENVASMKATRRLFREQKAGAVWPQTAAVPTAPTDLRRPLHARETGRGVVIGVIDWGFDFAHPDFRRPDEGTRLLALWDQGAASELAVQSPYGYGVIHGRKAIDAALAAANPYDALGYRPSDSDPDGHGTHGAHVAGIATGNGRSGGPCGVAPEADLIFVQLASIDQLEPNGNLADSATLLEGVDFVRRCAGGRPWVINLSMGQTGDPHDGTTLVEQGLDAALAEAPGRAIVQSCGNYHESRLHSSGRVAPGEVRSINWSVEGSGATEIEIWVSGRDYFEVELLMPDGMEAGRAAPGERVQMHLRNRRIGTLHNRIDEPNNCDNHILARLEPGSPVGNWSFRLRAKKVADGGYHVWIQREESDDHSQSRFASADADPNFTTNSICNGRRTIAVGAFDAHASDGAVASFSSRGPTRDGRQKPDLLAPGVRVLSVRSAPDDASAGQGRLVRMSGTSMAAPHVTGAIALMFEAARRTLPIDETRRILLESAKRGANSSQQPGHLDTDEATRRARGGAFGVRATAGRFSAAGLNSLKGAEMATNLNGGNSQPTASDDDLRVARADDLVAQGGPCGNDPKTFLFVVLSDSMDGRRFDPLINQGLVDPAALFDTFTISGRPGRQQADDAFEVVCRPGQFLSSALRKGDFLLRRALGEPGVGHVSIIADSVSSLAEKAASRGLILESPRTGIYARVVEPGARPHLSAYGFARRIGSQEGCLAKDTLILRPRQSDVTEKTPPSTVPSLALERLNVHGFAVINLEQVSGGRYQGFFRNPLHLRADQTPYAQTDARDADLIGRIRIKDASGVRDYDPSKDVSDWPLKGVTGKASMRPAKNDGVSFSSASEPLVKSDGSIAFSTNFGMSGYTRNLSIVASIDLSAVVSLSAVADVELLDLDGFLALVDPLETARPPTQTHLEFLASIRKVYQGGAKDPLRGAFDVTLFRNRNVPSATTPGDALDQKLQRYKDGLFADVEILDIGHVLTGIEGSPNQRPDKDQNIPMPPPRRELIVTWAGDLGSALQHYVEDFVKALSASAPIDVNDYLRRFASRVDLIGDIDGINIGSVYDPNRSLTDNLRVYYGTKSRRRFHQFIANTKDHNGNLELTIDSSSQSPRLSKSARAIIAQNIHSQFLLPALVVGKIDVGKDPSIASLVNQIIDPNSIEMQAVVDYFVGFLENGLALER